MWLCSSELNRRRECNSSVRLAALYSDAFDINFGVVIFRLRAGFDATEQMEVQKGKGGWVWLDIRKVFLPCPPPPPQTPSQWP